MPSCLSWLVKHHWFLIIMDNRRHSEEPNHVPDYFAKVSAPANLAINFRLLIQDSVQVDCFPYAFIHLIKPFVPNYQSYHLSINNQEEL